MYILQPHYYLRRILISKHEDFTIEGHKFFNVFETSFTFITNLNNITHEDYLKQPKSMLEWRLIEKLDRNFRAIKAFDRTLSHPLIREFFDVDPLEKQGKNLAPK